MQSSRSLVSKHRRHFRKVNPIYKSFLRGAFNNSHKLIIEFNELNRSPPHQIDSALPFERWKERGMSRFRSLTKTGSVGR